MLYMLNQLGAAIGIALVTVVMKTLGDGNVLDAAVSEQAAADAHGMR
ncbi:hypothetical protein SNL152K_1414 [Streptomyces sp. NL15-2K]|nr:hypothetical protein SNL152K_1414 [Streptomyces sp. NL15-2K]